MVYTNMYTPHTILHPVYLTSINIHKIIILFITHHTSYHIYTTHTHIIYTLLVSVAENSKVCLPGGHCFTSSSTSSVKPRSRSLSNDSICTCMGIKVYKIILISYYNIYRWAYKGEVKEHIRLAWNIHTLDVIR